MKNPMKSPFVVVKIENYPLVNVYTLRTGTWNGDFP